MTKNILIKPRGKEITLADGKTYMLSPVNLNILAALEEEFDCNLDELDKKLGGKQASALRTLLYILLKDNHPKLDKKQIGELVTLDNMADVSSVVAEILTAAKAVEEGTT